MASRGIPGLERYSRQLGILGLKGQEALARARVAVVGLGGLGSAVSLYLAAAGVGEMVLVDPDRVEVHNLNRQVLYEAADIGIPKAFLAARRLKALNPEVDVRPVTDGVSGGRVGEIVGDVDVIVDALDNWEARLALDEYAWERGIPLVHAAVDRWYGQLTVVKRGVTSCLACIAPRSPRRPSGVLGPAVGILGLLEAMEAIKILTGIGEPSYNRLIFVDALKPSIDVVELKPVPCEACREALRASSSPSTTGS